MLLLTSCPLRWILDPAEAVKDQWAAADEELVLFQGMRFLELKVELVES
jgi:hypothetical protein